MRAEKRGAKAWRDDLVLSCLVVSVSLAVRIAALMHWGTGAIEDDGAGYAMIAENLRKGVGFVGMIHSGVELNTLPLLPLLISGVSFVTGSYVKAGRLVTLIFGAFLPLPVFGIASRLFNRRTAFVATALTILHPLLINLAFAVLPEGPYLTLLLSAVYLTLCALSRPSIPMWCGVGGAFGLAYLVRPEAVAPLLIAAFFAFTATEGRLAIRRNRCIAAIAIFTVWVLPEVILIYRATGRVMLDGKSTIVLALDTRILAAQASSGGNRVLAGTLRDQPSSEPNSEDWQPWEQKWGAQAINADLQGTGVYMRPTAEVIRDTHLGPKEIGRIIGRASRQNAPAFLNVLSSKWVGAPFLPALALLGAIRRPWRQPLAMSRLFVLLVPVTAVVATFTVLWTYPRFYFVIIPFLLIWAANGLVGIGLWAQASAVAVGWRWLHPGICHGIIPALIGLAAVIYPINAVRALHEFDESSPASRIKQDIGLWIGRQQDRQVRIMDSTLPIACYAHAHSVLFPYCDAELALRFLDVANVDYVVLHGGEKFTKYYEDWLANGIPDPRAQLVYVSTGEHAGEFKVFRWHRPNGDAQKSYQHPKEQARCGVVTILCFLLKSIAK